VLERIGTPDAVQLLTRLAEEGVGTWIEPEAKAARERLQSRPADRR